MELKTKNPKSEDVDKLKLEVETLKFNYEMLMSSSAQVVEKVDKLKIENKKIIETIKSTLMNNNNNPNPSTTQEVDLIKAIENVNSLDEFVYKKDFKDAVEHLTIGIEDLVNSNTKSCKSCREIM